MYKGTLIDDLMRKVEQAEDSVAPPAPEGNVDPSRGVESRAEPPASDLGP